MVFQFEFTAVSEARVLQVNESLSELERAALLINGKDPIQVAAAMRSLPVLVSSHGRLVLDSLLPIIKRSLASLHHDSSVELAQAFTAIVQGRMLQTRDIVESISPMVLHHIKTMSGVEVGYHPATTTAPAGYRST